MKTLYYAVKIRDIGFMSNEGFIIVKLEKNKIKSIEGILTEDFIIADINNSSILLNYYAREDDIGEYLKEFSIDLDYNDIEIPLNITIDLDFKTVEIQTVKKIEEKDKQNNCEKILQELKNNVFKKGRS